MSEPDSGEQQVMVLGPDGQPIAVPSTAVAHATQMNSQAADAEGDGARVRTGVVEHRARGMRSGSMIRQLLEEGKSAPPDDASRNRLKEIHASSIKELESGLAP